MAGNSSKSAQDKQDLSSSSAGDSQLPAVPSIRRGEDVSVTLSLSNSALRALSFLGSRRVIDSVLDILEMEHAVSLSDVGRRPGDFLRGIQLMFGPGAYIIVKMICAEIARDLGVSREGRGLEELVGLAYGRSHGTKSSEKGKSEEIVATD